MEKKTCVAMVPCPGQGHLIPQVEFAKRLLHRHNDFHVTFLVPTLGPPKSSTMSTLNSLPPSIDFTVLPQVNMEDLPHHDPPHPVPQMIHTVKLSLPSLRKAISSLSSRTRLVALVFDVFSMDALVLAKEFNLSSYVFFSSGAATLSFSFGFPKFDESISSHEDFLQLSKTMDVLGCATPLQVRDLPDPLLFARSGEIYKSYLSVVQRLPLVDGVLVNTFTDLEVDSMEALQQRNNNNSNNPFVYPIGPIIQAKQTPSQSSHESQCVTWLDNQPPNSVLYISFGSGGTLTRDQLNEIAFGLELSGHKFLWVVRAPSDYANADYILGQKGDPLIHLPSGFLERTKGQGLVVPDWAPQIEILAHGSTGGFLSHCGWNSTLESVVHGVPMIAWPLFAEQRMNAILLKDVLKVAVRPSVDDASGVVKRHKVASVVKRVMEGGAGEGLDMRKRMKQLSDAAVAAVGEDGSSTKALSSCARKLLMARDIN